MFGKLITYRSAATEVTVADILRGATGQQRPRHPRSRRPYGVNSGWPEAVDNPEKKPASRGQALVVQEAALATGTATDPARLKLAPSP